MLKALVIGATGATGKELVKQLIENESFDLVTIFVRKNYSLVHPKLVVHQVDFDSPEQWSELVVGDVAYLAMGTTLKTAGSKEEQWKVDYNYQYHFARIAKNNKVASLVLVSAMGANERSKVFYSRMKGTLETAIRVLNFEKTLVFQPGLLIRPDTDRPSEKTFEKLMLFFNSLGIAKKYRPIKVSDLAAQMISCSLTADAGFRRITTKELFAVK